MVLHDERRRQRRCSRRHNDARRSRGGGIWVLGSVRETGKSCLGIASRFVRLGNTGFDNGGVIGFDLDEDAVEGNAVDDRVVIQILQRYKWASSCVGHYGGNAPRARRALSVRKDRDLGTHLTGISSNTQRVTLRRGGGGGFVGGGGALSRGGAKVLVIHSGSSGTWITVTSSWPSAGRSARFTSLMVTRS